MFVRFPFTAGIVGYSLMSCLLALCPFVQRAGRPSVCWRSVGWGGGLSGKND
ncbi:hypothetical protein GCWU000246_00379 [Jonquetella anthropi E3_33 E1]|nr:hypothetical protein GCWU000246_00379 [Jonquetella anthropi E3_33 E1]